MSSTLSRLLALRRRRWAPKSSKHRHYGHPTHQAEKEALEDTGAMELEQARTNYNPNPNPNPNPTPTPNPGPNPNP